MFNKRFYRYANAKYGGLNLSTNNPIEYLWSIESAVFERYIFNKYKNWKIWTLATRAPPCAGTWNYFQFTLSVLSCMLAVCVCLVFVFFVICSRFWICFRWFSLFFTFSPSVCHFAMNEWFFDDDCFSQFHEFTNPILMKSPERTSKDKGEERKPA